MAENVAFGQLLRWLCHRAMLLSAALAQIVGIPSFVAIFKNHQQRI